MRNLMVGVVVAVLAAIGIVVAVNSRDISSLRRQVSELKTLRQQTEVIKTSSPASTEEVVDEEKIVKAIDSLKHFPNYSGYDPKKPYAANVAKSLNLNERELVKFRGACMMKFAKREQ